MPDNKNYNIVYDALMQAGREDLIGNGPKCLIKSKEQRYKEAHGLVRKKSNSNSKKEKSNNKKDSRNDSRGSNKNNSRGKNSRVKDQSKKRR